jgi:hypothetical protein
VFQLPAHHSRCHHDHHHHNCLRLQLCRLPHIVDSTSPPSCATLTTCLK